MIATIIKTSIVAAALALTACSGTASNTKNVSANVQPKAASTPAPVYGYEVVKAYPHDPTCFTQGLIVRDGVFYESCGQENESTIRKVEISTGKVLKKTNVAPEYFAEGLAEIGGKLFQLTWRDRTAFVYNMDLKLEREFKYAGEGWGLTDNGKELIQSDGTHVIRFVDPETFKTIRTIVVNREDGKPQLRLNELEFVKGEIWANIWHSEDPEVLGRSNYIARIDPETGKMLGWIDLDGISPDDQRRDSENTLNGIAYDAASDRIFVTGKRWKKLFEIKLTGPKQQ